MFWGLLKNGLNETVVLSANNIGFGWEIRKIIISYTLLSGGLDLFSFSYTFYVTGDLTIIIKWVIKFSILGVLAIFLIYILYL